MSQPFTEFFVHSPLPIHYKFSSWSYLVSYYAISVAVPLSILGYILYGLFIPTIDAAYMPSWQVNVSLAIRYALRGLED